MTKKVRIGTAAALVLCSFLLVFLTACGKPADNTSPAGESGQSEESAESAPPTDYTDEKDGYSMKIDYKDDGSFDFTLTPKEQVYSEDKYHQPFKNIFSTDVISGTVLPNTVYRHVAEIKYQKRPDGAFIYSNNPEMLAPEDVGQALLRNYDMSGEYTFTFEHSNKSEEPFYLGYQILNTGDTEISVTVTNIGLQVEGEWLGQRSWSDYFNYKFTLPDDYFLASGKVNPMYVGCDYIYYEPRIFTPVTVKVPAGEYIYVLGGTSADASGNTNIGGTADKSVLKGRCSNGAVKFSIEGGTAQGTFYCYTDAAQVKANPAEQGYIVTRNDLKYAAQYKGTDYNQGLIESNISFIVNDRTSDGKLAVTYTKEADPNYASKTEPYNPYTPVSRKIVATEWMTSLNPNSANAAIGTDMMVFEYIDEDGNPIIIDNLHADGAGEPANTGNWMVQYTDNFTFVNVGNKVRTFKIYKRGATSGALFTMIRNDKGEILDAKMKAHPYYFTSKEAIFAGVNIQDLVLSGGIYWFRLPDGRPYSEVIDERALVYEVTVQPMSSERVSVDYLILGNSNGGISHWVELGRPE